MREHAISDLFDLAHTGPQNVGDRVIRGLKFCYRLGADHAPVGHNAHAADLEALLEPFNDGQKCCDIGRVAGPHLTADGLALIVDDGPDHHLDKIGPVVLAEASLPDALPAAALEVDRGGVEKDQIQIREQIPAMGEDKLLDKVLVAAG